MAAAQEDYWKFASIHSYIWNFNESVEIRGNATVLNLRVGGVLVCVDEHVCTHEHAREGLEYHSSGPGCLVF